MHLIPSFISSSPFIFLASLSTAVYKILIFIFHNLFIGTLISLRLFFWMICHMAVSGTKRVLFLGRCI